MLRAGSSEQRAHHVDDRDVGAVGRRHDREAAPRERRREVGRPDHTGGRREVGGDLLAAPRVVAERDRVGAGGEDPLGELRRDAHAVGDVLPVDDADVGVELRPEIGEAGLERVAAGSADDVRDEEDVQGRDPAAGWTSIETLLPRARACFASAWRSTAATSTTVPSFDEEASTGLPTASEGPARDG